MATKLEEAIHAYEEARTKGQEIWGIYEGKPNPKGVTDKALASLAKKLGRALPADFEEFLRRHDGWDGYEYDHNLLSAKDILGDASEFSIEVNMDNMDEDAADALENVFVIGLENDTATILYYDTTKKDGEPELVKHFVEEQGRWPNLTAYIRELTEHLERAVASERGTQAAAVADWDPATRKKKEEAFRDELGARWKNRKLVKPSALEGTSPDAIDGVPKAASALSKDGLHTYLGFCGYLLYVPTAEEVTAAALAFRKHFPWKGKVKACAPSDEYGAKEISPDATNFEEFLNLQSGGHFGLRMVDDAKGHSGRIFNFRGLPPDGDEVPVSFLEIMVPVSEKPASLRSLVLELADVLPLAHGLAGYFALPSNGKWVPHMKTLYGWCRAHWALEISHADDFVPIARHGLQGVSWLTVLDSSIAKTVKKALPKRGVKVHDCKRASVIEADDAPSLGDIRVEYPKTIAGVHNVLAPLMATGLEEIDYFSNQGGSVAWWRRFEDPAGFAIGPKDLFKAIKAAVTKRDGKALRSAIGRLSREAAASLHQELSDLAMSALDTSKPMAVILYEHLTAGEEPHEANLCNALLALEKGSDPKVVDLFIERGLEQAKENPSIFYNAMCARAVQGDIAGALAELERGAPHYTVELSKLLDGDKDLVALKGMPKFAALQQKIRQRLGIDAVWAPLARNPELEKRVGENPESAAEYRKYAKWLTKNGDPRGALIEAHMAVAKNERSKPAREEMKRLFTPYLRNRFQARFPKLAEYFKVEDFRWGVLDRMYLSSWQGRHRALALEALGDPELLLLRTLYVDGMKVDLAELAKKVPYLTELNLKKATFPELEPIRAFTQLEQLRLVGTAVTDLRSLKGLARLRELYIGDTAITDLRPLKEIPSLELLSLDGAKVKNIEPLFDLPNLGEVWLYKTAVSKADSERLEKHIRSRKPKRGSGMVYGP